VVYTKSTAKLADEFKIPSTSSKDHLPFFFDHPRHGDFCIRLAEWLKTNTLLNTNVRKFREHYIVNGKVHPIYSLWTAVTGRTASRDPNGQNYPKRGEQAKAYRKIFVAPPGYVMLEADLSQAELRIAADIANDLTMLRIYRENGDIHKYTACIVLGITLDEFEDLPKAEQKLARFKAKAVNFGFLYGMWWRKFIIYAKTQYGVEFTEAEAQRIRNGFFETYYGLAPWHDATREFVLEHGYVRSYSGRIRHLPMVWSEDERIQQEAVRQAINSPVQNFASDLGVMALSRIDQEVDPQYLAVVGFVHDALYALVPERYVEWGAKTLKHYMETNPLEQWFGRRMKLPIVADVAFGWNGGETFEMKGLEQSVRFDFDSIAMDSDGNRLFELPRQFIPKGNGRTTQPEYLRLSA
jgi:DNA polymerase I-like protein with 3'-5' exonuclease and polymerase domains